MAHTPAALVFPRRTIVIAWLSALALAGALGEEPQPVLPATVLPGGLKWDFGWQAASPPAASPLEKQAGTSQPLLKTDRFSVDMADGWLHYRMDKSGPLKSDFDAQTNGGTAMFVLRWHASKQ